MGVVFAQFFVSLCFLFYAAIKDIKTREVPNRTWLLYALFTLPLAAINLYGENAVLIFVYATSVLGVFAVSLVTFYFNGWGGADAKAVVCLSLGLGYTVFNVLFLGLIFYFAYSVKHKFSRLKKGYNAPFLVFLFAAFLVIAAIELLSFLF